MKSLVLLILALSAGCFGDRVSSYGESEKFWMWQEGINAPCTDVVWVGPGPDRLVIYMGRVQHEDSLVPAIVQEFNSTAVYSFQGKLHTSDKYEVLCGSVAWQRVLFPARLPFTALQVGYLTDKEPLFACRSITHDRNEVMVVGVIDPGSLACNISYGQEGYFNKVAQRLDYEVLIQSTV